MTLLAPLGLLGLIGILILIIIYIIKPNYQQKYISSTFIWKLSLKYRKKKIPVSKLRNILLIICQVLILTASALILAKPAEILKNQVEVREVIAIIDSSASMRTTSKTENGTETRFARAVETTIFVKNAPSYAGIGFGGEGHTTFTIAGPTGEGLTSARSFTRYRRCVMADSFRII